MLAMLVAGYMAKQSGGPAISGGSAGGGLGDLLGGLLGGSGATAAPTRTAAPSGGIASMLDLNGDGNPLDDILRMAGKAFK